MRRLAIVALLAIGCSNGASKEPATPATGSAAAAAPASAHPPGRVAHHRFASEALGVEKAVVVYLPAGYGADPAKRWPVFYYLHGLGGEETNWVEGGKLDRAADALELGAIVVMPDGDDGFYANAVTPADYDACIASGAGLFIPKRPRATTCVRKRDYETYIVRDLIGWVDRTFSTIAAREGRAIAGLSMGGFGALQLALRHPDLFAAAASHSGVDALLYGGPVPYEKGKVVTVTDVSTWGGSDNPIGPWVRSVFGPDLARWQAHDPVALARTLEPGRLALYLDCGTEDEFRLQHGMQHLHDVLLERRIEHAYYIGPGHHDMRFWSARLPESLAFLRAHTQAAR